MKNFIKILPIMVFVSILIIACTKDESNQIQTDESIENQAIKTSELYNEELKYSKVYSQIQIAKDKDGNLLVAVPNTDIVYVLQTTKNYNVSSMKIKSTDYQIEQLKDKPEILYFKSSDSSNDFVFALNDYVSDDAFLKGMELFKGYGIIEISSEKLNKIVTGGSLGESDDIDPSNYRCQCISNENTSDISCEAGGRKSTSCSYSVTHGGTTISCSVTCSSGSFACCNEALGNVNNGIESRN